MCCSNYCQYNSKELHVFLTNIMKNVKSECFDISAKFSNQGSNSLDLPVTNLFMVRGKSYQ